jgi:endoglucanase
MQKLRILLVIISFILIGCTNSMEKFKIKRGLNVSHWLSQSDVRGDKREQYIQEKDFQLIAELGFDHVRLPFDEEQMWDEEGAKYPEAFTLMHNAIQWSLKNNLNIIIDLHVLRSHHFNRPDSRKLWEDKSAQEGFIKFWKDLSEELKKYPNENLAYEPLNEAVSDNPEDWNKLINWVISEIRELEPERTIIMGSNNWQQVGTFKDLEVPQNDNNIILSFHYYEPFLLTHYQAPWTNLKDLTIDINYPGAIVDTTQYAELNEDEIKLIKERYAVNNLEKLEEDIYQAVEVADKHGLKLYCGEFGAFPITDIEMRKRWYKDMIAAFDKYNIAWAHWNYKNDFPIVSQDLKPIEKIMEILIPHK